jgi:hypothetical protein
MHNGTPCFDYKCPHNLFWEGLKLDMDKIQMTEKTFLIRNCCCLIHDPWTPEEIATAWGLTKKGVRRCEEMAWRKVQSKRYSKESSQAIPTVNNGVTMGKKGVSRKRIPPQKQPPIDAIRVE